MKALLTAAMIAAIAAVSAPASAAVIYQLDFHTARIDAQVVGQLPDFVSTSADLSGAALTSCTFILDGAPYDPCGTQHKLYADTTLEGSATDDFDVFSFSFPLDQSYAPFRFINGALGAVGMYAGVDNDSSVQTFLTVSGAADAAVPEPAGWALLIAGFSAAGAALRRRRIPV